MKPTLTFFFAFLFTFSGLFAQADLYSVSVQPKGQDFVLQIKAAPKMFG